MATVITGSKNAVMDGHAYNDYIYTLLPAQIQPSVGLMQAGASVGVWREGCRPRLQILTN